MIKVFSNATLTNYFPESLNIKSGEEIDLKGTRKITSGVALIQHLLQYDIILILNPSFNWFLKCTAIKLLSLGRIKIVFFDVLLPKPYSLKDNIKAFIKRLSFKFADRFIFLHKDTSGYSRYYGIKAKKCIYIPFKANNINMLSDFEVHDLGYLLSCGASYRDYNLLAKALKIYPCKTIILLPDKNQIEYHHSIIDEELFNNNAMVEIVRHDFNRKSWNDILSKCRAVVLPIRSDVVQCAGISVYLEAMAFGKPVIITEGPATKGLLSQEIAAICPPDNPESLAAAIKKIWEDEEYRKILGNVGRNYALSLGGEDRLVKDILKTIISL